MPLSKQEQIDLAWKLLEEVNQPWRHWRHGWVDELFARDGDACFYCRTRLFKGGRGPFLPTLDHVIPLSLGGDDDLSNCVLACSTCNTAKDNLHPSEQEEISALQILAHRRIAARTLDPEEREAATKAADRLHLYRSHKES